MSGSNPGVPAVPILAAALVEEHRRAHAELSERVDAEHRVVGTAFAHLSSRLLVEGLAKLQPVLADIERPLLVPAPRRFLSPGLTQRYEGAASAFRHVDSKVAMIRAGSVPHIIDTSTPEVLNALLQGPVRHFRETNPGLVRATSTNWAPESNTFEHPPAEHCGQLIERAVEVAQTSSAPAIAVAGWLAFTLMTIHPFVDGNGRTARACAHAVASAGLPNGVDWGMLEQWCLARTEYVDALQAGQRVPRYAADDVDPLPFMEFAAASSARGAVLSIARIDTLGRVARELAGRGLPDAGVQAVLTVAIDRHVPAGSLAMAVTGAATAAAAPLDIVEGLVDQGFLAWAPRPVGSNAREHPGTVGAALGPRVADVATALKHLRFGDALR